MRRRALLLALFFSISFLFTPWLPAKSKPKTAPSSWISHIDISGRHYSMCLGSLNRAGESAYRGRLSCQNAVCTNRIVG